MNHYERRFGGIGRLFGKEGLERSRRAHVCVIGLGGVGSWAVEALARSGIGALTLVDLDDVCISNVNRQLHALDGELGKPKVEVLARRVRAINPDCVVHPVQAFFLKSNACEILHGATGVRPSPGAATSASLGVRKPSIVPEGSEPAAPGDGRTPSRYDYVLDAIDSPARKCLLIALCREMGIPVITTGASAGRRDPTAVQVMDLAFSSHDRLLQEVRKKLRTRHGFPRGEQPFGVDCVVSREPVVYPNKDGSVGGERATAPDLRLDCDTGFGTASFVTGAFGLVAASRIVQHLVAA
jgi:tRNA A37 threonylcarbamoyladenosine dehydratase